MRKFAIKWSWGHYQAYLTIVEAPNEYYAHHTLMTDSEEWRNAPFIDKCIESTTEIIPMNKEGVIYELYIGE